MYFQQICGSFFLLIILKGLQISSFQSVILQTKNFRQLYNHVEAECRMMRMSRKKGRKLEREARVVIHTLTINFF